MAPKKRNPAGRPALFPEGQQKMLIRIPQDTYDHLKVVQIIHGMPMAEQMRRALALWVESNPVTKAQANGTRKGGK